MPTSPSLPRAFFVGVVKVVNPKGFYSRNLRDENVGRGGRERRPVTRGGPDGGLVPRTSIARDAPRARRGRVAIEREETMGDTHFVRDILT